MTELPSGTVTFLFTDIEGSTRLWQEQPETMQNAVALNDDTAFDAALQTGRTLTSEQAISLALEDTE